MGTSHAWLALTTRIIPVFAFLLALTFLDNSMLLVLGISRKMKNVVFYAPFELKGIGYPQMGLLQDQHNINHFVQQLQWGNEVVNDLHITLAQRQLQSGMIKLLMEHPDIWAPHIEQV